MKILIVDDNRDNRTTVELILEEFEGLEITHAVDGEDAIEKCKKEHFHIIFMDIMMPNIDGIEATKAIKSFDKSTMIIALSALDDEISKNKILKNGAEDYIVKPIESELFEQRMYNYLEIVKYREKAVHTTAFANRFGQNIHSRILTFRIDSVAELAGFWDYYLNYNDKAVENASDCVRMIYGFGLWILKTKHKFSIVAEESDRHLYFSLIPVTVISARVVKNVLGRHYPEAVYIFNEDILTFRLEKSGSISVDQLADLEISESDRQLILSKTHFDKIAAAEYVEATAISLSDKIDSLEEIEERASAALADFEQRVTDENLQKICCLLDEYVEVLQLLGEFEHLAFAVNALVTLLSGLTLEQLTQERVGKFTTLALLMLHDLGDWRVNIFVTQEANDIHYLDASLLSSCIQIENIFNDNEMEEEGDLEFF